MSVYQAILDYWASKPNTSFTERETYVHMLSQCLLLREYPIAHVKVEDLTLDDYIGYISTLMIEGYEDETLNDQAILLTEWMIMKLSLIQRNVRLSHSS